MIPAITEIDSEMTETHAHQTGVLHNSGIFSPAGQAPDVETQLMMPNWTWSSKTALNKYFTLTSAALGIIQI